MKKFGIIVLTLILCLSLTSCATIKAIMYDPNAKVEEEIIREEVIETVSEESQKEMGDIPETPDIKNELTGKFNSSMLVMIPLMGVSLILTILCLAAQWKLFIKAGEKGWKCLIPIYNMWVLFKITYGEGIRMFLTWVPIAGIIFLILFCFDFAEAYGKKGMGFKLGLVLLAPIFFMIMGLSKNIKYVGPKVKK